MEATLSIADSGGCDFAVWPQQSKGTRNQNLVVRFVQFDFAARHDGDHFGRWSAIEVLDLADHVHAVDHAPEHHVPPVEPRRFHGANEELRPVGVGPRVRHRERARARVLQLEVFVRKLLAVNGLAASAVTAGEVTTLCLHRLKRNRFSQGLHAFRKEIVSSG